MPRSSAAVGCAGATFDFDGVLTQILKLLLKIRVESRKLGAQYQQIASTIVNAFESHWDELFVPNPIIYGKKVPFRRHNNGLESSHRRIRKAIRERTGKSETIVKNLIFDTNVLTL